MYVDYISISCKNVRVAAMLTLITCPMWSLRAYMRMFTNTINGTLTRYSYGGGG
jgi:hypothetical protein